MMIGAESPYGTVYESPGFLAPGPPQMAPMDPVNPIPVAAVATTPAAAPSSLMDTISAMPTWQLLALAAAAYFLFFKGGR